MIFCNDGKCNLDGSKIDLMADLASIVRSLLVSKILTEDNVMYAVELGCKDKETVHKEAQEALCKMFDAIFKGNKNEQAKATDEDIFNKMFGDLKDE